DDLVAGDRAGFGVDQPARLDRDELREDRDAEEWVHLRMLQGFDRDDGRCSYTDRLRAIVTTHPAVPGFPGRVGGEGSEGWNSHRGAHSSRSSDRCFAF